MRQRVLAREPLFGMFIFSDSATNVEIVARSGLDWVLIDLEHGIATEAQLLPMLLATRGTGASPLVRVEAGTRIRVGRALDLGAHGVMVPQARSVDDADAVVRWMRAQPDGERGVAMFTRGMDYGAVGHDGVSRRHEDLVTIIQIETRGALEAVEAIAAIDGVDVLFVGPTDLSHALGVPGRLEEQPFEDALSKVGRAAAAAGKAAGVLLRDAEDVRRYAAHGFSFFGIASDALMLDRTVRAAQADARSILAATPTPEVT